MVLSLGLLVGVAASAQTTTTTRELPRPINARVGTPEALNRIQDRAKLQAERRAELTERLTAIKDERRQQAVLKINDQLQKLNDRITVQFAQILDRQEAIMGRIVTRVEEMATAGRDVTQAQINLTKARAALATARAAVTAQAAKIYNPEINTVASLRTDLGTVRQALRTDLQAVRETIRAVHEALRLTVTGLAGIARIGTTTPINQ